MKLHTAIAWVRQHPLYTMLMCWLLSVAVLVCLGDFPWQRTPPELPEPEIIYETVYVEVVPDSRLPFYRSISENMSEDEYHLLAALVKEEAGNQSFTGQRCVVEVVFNRILDPRFPDTITEVIMQKNQFSVAHRLDKSKPTQEQYDAIDATLSCVEPVMPKEVLFFASVKMNRPLYDVIGGHNFYYSKG